MVCPGICSSYVDGIDPTFLGHLVFPDGGITDTVDVKAPHKSNKNKINKNVLPEGRVFNCDGDQTGTLVAQSENTAQSQEFSSAKDATDAEAIEERQWTIILLCTEPNSLMVTRNPFPRNCKIKT